MTKRYDDVITLISRLVLAERRKFQLKLKLVRMM